MAYKFIDLPAALRVKFSQKNNQTLLLKQEKYYDYNRFTSDPDDVFKECVEFSNEIRLLMKTKDGESPRDTRNI